MAPKELNFITGNANKLAEVRAILSEVEGLELQNQNLDLPELQGTIEEITRDKCGRAADIVRILHFPLHGPERVGEGRANDVSFFWVI